MTSVAEVVNICYAATDASLFSANTNTITVDGTSCCRKTTLLANTGRPVTKVQWNNNARNPNTFGPSMIGYVMAGMVNQSSDKRPKFSDRSPLNVLEWHFLWKLMESYFITFGNVRPNLDIAGMARYMKNFTSIFTRLKSWYVYNHFRSSLNCIALVDSNVERCDQIHIARNEGSDRDRANWLFYTPLQNAMYEALYPGAIIDIDWFDDDVVVEGVSAFLNILLTASLKNQDLDTKERTFTLNLAPPTYKVDDRDFTLHNISTHVYRSTGRAGVKQILQEERNFALDSRTPNFVSVAAVFAPNGEQWTKEAKRVTVGEPTYSRSETPAIAMLTDEETDAEALFRVKEDKTDRSSRLNAPITENGRTFTCPTCNLANQSDYDRTIDTGIGKFENSSSVIFEGEFLDVDQLQTDVSDAMTTLDANVKRYKELLKAKQEDFELYFTTDDASEDLFNRLNVVIAKMDNCKKMLDDWYASLQVLVSDIWEGITLYAEAKHRLLGFGLHDDHSQTLGLAVNPVKLAKRNRTRLKALNTHRNKASNAEAKIRKAVFLFGLKLKDFNKGLIRTDSGGYLNLIELSELIESLYEERSPLIRIQNELAQIINSSRVKVVLQKTNIEQFTENLNDKSFLEELATKRNVDESDIIKNLQSVAGARLYTFNTSAVIEKIMAYAEAHVNTEVNKTKMAKLIGEIRDRSPSNVLKKLQLDVREENLAFENVAYIKRLLKSMHHKDRLILQRPFIEVLNETYGTIRKSLEDLTVKGQGSTYMDTDGEGSVFKKEEPYKTSDTE